MILEGRPRSAEQGVAFVFSVAEVRIVEGVDAALDFNVTVSLEGTSTTTSACNAVETDCGMVKKNLRTVVCLSSTCIIL